MASHDIVMELNLNSASDVGITVLSKTTESFFSYVSVYSSVYHLLERRMRHIARSTDVPLFLSYNDEKFQ